jgi:segregation and condensation protein B
MELDFGLGDVIEALLFVSDQPLSPAQIGNVLEESEDRVRESLSQLRKRYQGGGLRIVVHNDLFQMTTAPDAAPYCRMLLGLEVNQRLTQASLETAAIIAYQQPVTRATIEEIRGVNSDSPLARLVSYGLVVALGKSNLPGRPLLYGTTVDFLAYFGLGSLDELPGTDLADLSLPHSIVRNTHPPLSEDEKS